MGGDEVKDSYIHLDRSMELLFRYVTRSAKRRSTEGPDRSLEVIRWMEWPGRQSSNTMTLTYPSSSHFDDLIAIRMKEYTVICHANIDKRQADLRWASSSTKTIDASVNVDGPVRNHPSGLNMSKPVVVWQTRQLCISYGTQLEPIQLALSPNWKRKCRCLAHQLLYR